MRHLNCSGGLLSSLPVRPGSVIDEKVDKGVH